jgi:radical SAM protein with 4Fe4S-binding SPASM domain
MEWLPEVHILYKNIISRVPEAFRATVQPMLLEASQKKCMQRNSSLINEADLVTALFEITPTAFQPQLKEDLIELKVDINKYIKLTEIQDQFKRSWEEYEKAFHPGNYWFTLYLSDKCNQKCLHCAADTYTAHRPELSADQWIQIIDNLETSLNKVDRRGVYIWFGGEALLRKDIRKLMRYAGDRGLFHAISTNGILYDKDFAKFCVETNMSHSFISLDSINPEKAAKIRGVQNAYEVAKRAIDTSLEHGFLTMVTATVMKQNIDELEEIKETIESWGAIPYFRAVIKQKNASDNWNKIGLSTEDYKRFYEFKYKMVIDAIRDGKAGTLPIFSIYDMVPFMEHPLNDSEMTALEWGTGCQACRTISGIDINGDVFPCDYPSELRIGNALKESFTEIMNSQIFKDIRDRKRVGKCSDCHHLELCGGGCRVHAENETGDFFSSCAYCWHENH